MELSAQQQLHFAPGFHSVLRALRTMNPLVESLFLRGSARRVAAWRPTSTYSVPSVSWHGSGWRCCPSCRRENSAVLDSSAQQAPSWGNAGGGARLAFH